MRVGTLRPVFVVKALRNYNPNGVFVYKEFIGDIQKIMFLSRYFNQCKRKNDVYQPKVLINYYLALKNAFGDKANELLFEQSDEKVYPEIMAMLSFMNEIPENGIMNFSFGDLSLDVIGTNAELLTCFRKEFGE